jgi:hypothetical protein
MTNYADMVAAAMQGKQGMEEWADYLTKLSKFQERQKELMKDVFSKHKGLSNAEIAAKVLPILKREGLCDGLPEYVVNGY